MAREHAPSIIFMDEIDSIGGQRQDGESGGDSEVQRTMLELLNQVRFGVFVVGGDGREVGWKWVKVGGSGWR